MYGHGFGSLKGPLQALTSFVHATHTQAVLPSWPLQTSECGAVVSMVLRICLVDS